MQNWAGKIRETFDKIFLNNFVKIDDARSLQIADQSFMYFHCCKHLDEILK